MRSTRRAVGRCGRDQLVGVFLDHRHRSADPVGDEDGRAIGRPSRRPQSHVQQETRHDRILLPVGHRHRIARLRRDVRSLSAGTDRYAFGLDAHHERGECFSRSESRATAVPPSRRVPPAAVGACIRRETRGIANYHYLSMRATASDPGGDRTRDLRIKSPLLYQLSYRVG